MKIVLIDICGTLYRSNTTFDFLNFFLVDHKGYNFFRKISNFLFWRALNNIIFKYLNFDLTRSIAVSFLDGFSKYELIKAANDFYEGFLSQKRNGTIIQFVEQLKDANHKLILTSATLDFIAETIATKLSISEFYATSLGYDNHFICTGKIKNDLLGKKQEMLQKNGLNPPYYMCITDNFSDLDLLKKSQWKYIVTYSGAQKRWKRVFPEDVSVSYFSL